jgi:hypothetical protein
MVSRTKIERLRAGAAAAVLVCLLLVPALWTPAQLAAQAEDTTAGDAEQAEGEAQAPGAAAAPGEASEPAEAEGEAQAAAGSDAADGGEAGADESRELARGFNNILLGMNMEDVKEELKEDPNFNFRGDPDVSMMRTPNTSLIECRGYYYVERASFQFIDDSLYTITIILDPKRIGHYAMFTALTDSYGEPDTLSPEKSRWENATVIISLERPLRVKYMAKKVLERLKREQRRKKSMETLTRERFLEQF